MYVIFCVFMKMLCYCRLFTDILADSLDSTEIELTRDGHWHVTKTEEADDDTPCHSPKPEQTVEGLQSFCHKLIRTFSFVIILWLIQESHNLSAFWPLSGPFSPAIYGIVCLDKHM